ncbi:guanine-1-methyltransferase-domain-containing protein [Sordaria brevicollis]|uniref:tRNA (guanine(9)-N1)-methyltransferase n=1 Tax=Sordaria brevicollis TaxID=83679 RepID=A0AAE0UDV3_SORBR|nr:guanine-1-methyltransferase-domain-containing protein [Sordaria brevicollis]
MADQIPQETVAQTEPTTDTASETGTKRKAEEQLTKEMVEQQQEQTEQSSAPVEQQPTVTEQTTTTTTTTTENNTQEPPAQEQQDGNNASPQPADDDSATPATNEDGTPKLSKNQLKRLRRAAAHEAFRAERKEKRKEKRHIQQAKKRALVASITAEAAAAGVDADSLLREKVYKKPWVAHPVPVAFIIDCHGFESYMRDNEVVSLSSQIVRSYSMNRRAKYQAQLVVSGWEGKLRERFEKVLNNAHRNWKGGVRCIEGDFLEAAKVAKRLMEQPEVKEGMIDLIKPSGNGGLLLPEPEPEAEAEPETTVEETVEGGDAAPKHKPEPYVPEKEAEDVDQSIVYLSAESDYTLDKLEANTCYVIGGLVDRNREKGLCYNRAKAAKVRTAKLPIGEYMAMQSRYVLTTNQVVEIMAKWLECGDWGEAFLTVIPKRKGGTLKAESSCGTPAPDNGDGAEEEEKEEQNGVDSEAVPAADVTQKTAEEQAREAREAREVEMSG